MKRKNTIVIRIDKELAEKLKKLKKIEKKKKINLIINYYKKKNVKK